MNSLIEVYVVRDNNTVSVMQGADAIAMSPEDALALAYALMCCANSQNAKFVICDGKHKRQN